MYGFVKNQRLWGATTSVDHVSDYVYVHLMRYLSLTETLLAKLAMEKVMSQAGRTVKHYHAQNGRFSDNGFIDAINLSVLSYIPVFKIIFKTEGGYLKSSYNVIFFSASELNKEQVSHITSSKNDSLK